MSVGIAGSKYRKQNILRMEKKSYQYRLTLEALKNPQGEAINKAPLELVFHNHDDLFKIIEIVKSKDIFKDSGESVEFSLGLKLLSEVILHNRDLPIFEELAPAIGLFMKKLKGK